MQESPCFSRGENVNAKAYEEQGNDRAANIIRSNYTGDYREQGKVVLDEAGEL